MSEANTMARIRRVCGKPIAAACEHQLVKPEFLAALIANESGGHFEASRFELGHFSQLAAVAAGRKPQFLVPGMSRPIERNELLHYCAPGEQTGMQNLPHSFSHGLGRLAELSTSYGWTQIMGWHALELSWTIGDLTDPARHLRRAIELLVIFANRYGLNLTQDFEQLARCWNTGKPEGKTFDPEYVQNLLARMAIYREIAEPGPVPALTDEDAP